MLKGKLRPPMLVREGVLELADHVHRDSDFFAIFISDHLDEALNPSLFEGGMRSAVRNAVRERAEIVLLLYVDERGNIRPKEWFEQKARRAQHVLGRGLWAYGRERRGGFDRQHLPDPTSPAGSRQTGRSTCRRPAKLIRRGGRSCTGPRTASRAADRPARAEPRGDRGRRPSETDPPALRGGRRQRAGRGAS